VLDALHQSGVSFIFANFGSDHSALIEAIAEARAKGRAIPEIITSPHEMVALSCAQGYAQLSGEAQAVLVHVECGTQSLAGAVHNASRSRSPVLIFAGMTPFTQEGELKGGRNEFIHWLQDVPDQRGIVRNYVKHDNELRTAANVAQVVSRELQIARSAPAGPVYLIAGREVMEEQAKPVAVNHAHWTPLAPCALPSSGVAAIIDAISSASRPLVVTSYVGRNPNAVQPLVRLCETFGAGLVESAPSAMNFPHSHPLYQGNYWNQPAQNEALAEADCVLVVDSDVPWIPAVNRPGEAARIFHIDVDPLKVGMTLWHIDAERSFAADGETALRQIVDEQSQRTRLDVSARTAHWAERHAARAGRLTRESEGTAALIPEYVTAAVRRHASSDAIFLNEGITNYGAIHDHVAPELAATLFASGASSLGWHGGAAIGMKLAAPQREVIALTGDGSYMFSIPSTVHWMARQYGTPFLTVVYNNRGWRAPRFSALAVHPDGFASRANSLDLAFDPPPDYAAIAAAAGGAFARTVTSADELEEALADGFRAIREERRAAVLDV
jgi:acetolactate synthase-1/2/3 large subunit